MWYRLKAFYNFFKGVESWGAMKREGFARRPTPLATVALKAP